MTRPVVESLSNPAIALPCGVDQNRMPFGLQVVGRFGGDIELFDAAQAMERAFTGIAAAQARIASNQGRRARERTFTRRFSRETGTAPAAGSAGSACSA